MLLRGSLSEAAVVVDVRADEISGELGRGSRLVSLAIAKQVGQPVWLVEAVGSVVFALLFALICVGFVVRPLRLRAERMRQTQLLAKFEEMERKRAAREREQLEARRAVRAIHYNGDGDSPSMELVVQYSDLAPLARPEL